jgi:hypothetical protein
MGQPRRHVVGRLSGCARPAAHPDRGLGALTARAVSSPEEVAMIRALGNSDQEHLARGRIDPYEITIRDVRVPPPKPRLGLFQGRIG